MIDCLRQIFFVFSKIKIFICFRWWSIFENNKNETKKEMFFLSFKECEDSENLNNCLTFDFRNFDVNVFNFEWKSKFNEILKSKCNVTNFLRLKVVHVFRILMTKFQFWVLNRFWRTFLTSNDDENDWKKFLSSFSFKLDDIKKIQIIDFSNDEN